MTTYIPLRTLNPAAPIESAPMTLTLTDVLRFRREWTPQQILAFAERIVAAASSDERRMILAEFKANLPDPANDRHPQTSQLLGAWACLDRKRPPFKGI